VSVKGEKYSIWNEAIARKESTANERMYKWEKKL
jgi:hypothetical protein